MSLKIETRVGISAPVDDVYDLIADIDNWPTWSPIHKAASGKLGFGASIHLEEQLEGLGVWETDGVIADWQPLSHIHVTVPKPFYAGTLIRYFEFDALSEKGSSFAVGALFTGFLSEREGKRFCKYIRAGFDSFADAVRVKAEAAFAEHPEDVSSAIVAPPPPVPPRGAKRKNWLGTHFWGKKS